MGIEKGIVSDGMCSRRTHWRAFDGGLRTAVMAVIALALVASGAHAQAAEAEWWQGIPGFGSPGYQEGQTKGLRPERGDRQKETLDDLRPDETPWRSDVMLEAIDLALERYQRIADKGGWPSIPPGRIMRPGDGDDRVPALRRRLSVTGDLRSRDAYGGYESYDYDQELEAAVKRFQQRHGLRVSGRADQPTLEALNVPVEARLAQMTLNRDRIRNLLQQPVEERYVLVNVPAYQLEAVERHGVQLRHRVIVGRPGRDTPQLKATIRALNFFPYWKVPDSVAQLDLIPRIIKEPEYLDAEKIRVVQGDFNGPEVSAELVDWSTADATKLKFRQDPGPQNALGLVRLDMSNEHGVYMHDTPLKKLFDQRQRAFSAGCVRIQDVFQLVEWVARAEPGWERPGRVEEVLAAGQPFEVELSRPVPVYFAYITAWAEPGGRVEFRPDLYGQDGSRELTAGLGRDPDEPAPPPSLAP